MSVQQPAAPGTAMVQAAKPQLPATLTAVKLQSGNMQIENILQIESVCNVLVASGYIVDKDGVPLKLSQAVTKCLFGHKLGLDPLESINDLYMFQGQCQAYARLHARKVDEHAHYAYEILELDAEKCVMRFYKNAKKAPSGEVTDYGKPAGPDIEFTIEQARKAGYLDKKYTPWNFDPESMLFNKVMTRGYRRYFPGLYKVSVITVEEAEEIGMQNERVDLADNPTKAARELAKEKAAERAGEIIDVTPQPTLKESLEAVAEVAEKIGDEKKAAVAKEAIAEIDSEAEKITRKDSIELNKFAAERGWPTADMVAHLAKTYGVREKSWTEDLKRSQLTEAKAFFETNRRK